MLVLVNVVKMFSIFFLEKLELYAAVGQKAPTMFLFNEEILVLAGDETPV